MAINKAKILGFALGPIGSALIGVISLPVLAWLFSAEDIGRITMLQVFSGLSVIVFSLGLDLAYVREYHEANNKHGLLKSAFVPGFFFTIIALLTCIAVSPVFLSNLFFSMQNVLFSALIAVCFVAVFVLRYISLVLRVQERGVAYSMSQILPRLFFLIVIFLCFIIKSELGFQDLLVAQAVSLLLAILIFFWVARLELYSAVKACFDYNKMRKMFGFGLPLVFAGLASWGMTAMDKFFLRSISSFSELGIYSIAISVAAAVGVVTSIFNTIWAPMVFKWTSEGVNPHKIDIVCEHMAATVLFLFVISGMFSWVIPFFLPVNYSQIQHIVPACMAAPLLYALAESTGIGLNISRRTSLSMLASCMAVGFSLFSNYLLVPKYGAAGAAAATAITFWFFFFLRTEFSCVAWRRFPKYKLYIGSGLASMAAVIVSLWGKQLGELSLILWMLVGSIGCIIYRKSLLSIHVCFRNLILSRKIPIQPSDGG